MYIYAHGTLGAHLIHTMIPRAVRLLEDDVIWPVPHCGLVSSCPVGVIGEDQRDDLVGRMEMTILI